MAITDEDAWSIGCSTVAERLGVEHVCCPSCVDDMNEGESCLQYEYGETSTYDRTVAVITAILAPDEWCEVCCELPRVIERRPSTPTRKED